jgi:hypothetical protein
MHEPPDGIHGIQREVPNEARQEAKHDELQEAFLEAMRASEKLERQAGALATRARRYDRVPAVGVHISNEVLDKARMAETSREG